MDERLRRRDHGDRAREGGNTWRVGLKTKGTEMREKKAAEGRAQEGLRLGGGTGNFCRIPGSHKTGRKYKWTNEIGTERAKLQ